MKKGALCWIDPESMCRGGQSTLESLGYLYCTFLPEPIESCVSMRVRTCVCVCVRAHVRVCGLRMGPFPWFHSSAVRMCLSEKEFGNVFLKQTRAGREKKRENGSASIFSGAQDGLYSMWGDFHALDLEIPPMCASVFVCACVCACVRA